MNPRTKRGVIDELRKAMTALDCAVSYLRSEGHLIPAGVLARQADAICTQLVFLADNDPTG